MNIKRLLKFIPLLVLLVLALIFLFNNIRFYSALKELRKDGFAITPKEFIEKHYSKVPDDQNAAETILKAGKLYCKPANNRNRYAYAPRLDQKISPALLALLQKHIANNAEFIQAGKALAGYDYVRFHYPWEECKIEVEDKNSIIRDLVVIQALRIESAIRENKAQEISGLLKSMFHLSYLCSQGPENIDQSLFYSSEAVSLSRLQRYMSIFTPSETELRYFYTVTDSHEKLVHEGWEKEWRLSIIFSLHRRKFIFSQVYESKWEKTLHNFGLALMFYIGGFSNDTIRSVKLTKKIINTPLDNYSKRKKSLIAIVNQSRTTLFSLFSENDYCLEYYVRTLRIIALLRCAKSACAVKLYQAKYRKLPEELEELVPEFMPSVPLDPFDGKPLRYFKGDFKVTYSTPVIPELETGKDLEYKYNTLDKNGFYIYSVGPNLKADKSMPLLEWSEERDDIDFILIEKKPGL
jgi:hypothetical protein